MKTTLFALALMLSLSASAQPILHQDALGTFINIVPVTVHINNPQARRLYLSLCSNLDSTVVPSYRMMDSVYIDSLTPAQYDRVDYGVLPSVKISNPSITLAQLKILLFTAICTYLGISYQPF